MTDLPLTGGCGCGAVRYEITEVPVKAGYCHCTRCQRRTGTAASPNLMVAPGSVRITQGEDKLTAWEPDGGFRKVFCKVCGSGLWSTPPDSDEPAGVRTGTVDGDPGVKPSYRQWLSSAAPWEPIPDDGLTRFPERRTD
jgi:hypothetical protein